MVVISNELDIVLEMWMFTVLPRFGKTRKHFFISGTSKNAFDYLTRQQVIVVFL